MKILLEVEQSLLKRAAWPVVALLLGAGLALGCGSPEPKKKSLPEVVVAKATQQDVPLYADWIGTAEGFNNATIRPQVKGYLLKIDYKQGTVVDSGSLLFEIDPREFKAELDSAKGQLGEAKANLAKRKTHVDRYRPLAAQGAVSQQEFDDSVQNMLSAEAGLLTAQARVEQARLNLGWTKITSPIEGVAGIAQAQIGDLVGPESTLTTVSQLNPIKVNFPISEKAYLEVVRTRGGGASGRGDLSNAGPILQLYLADGSRWPGRGTPFVLGRSVDEQTGTILIEGRFPNPNNVLRPGQFARVRVDIGTRKNALLVPQRAVSDIQGKYMLSVISSQDVVEVRPVEVGETVGENWIITKGLKADERVVVEGIQKVRSGMKVRPVSQGKDEKKGQTANTSQNSLRGESQNRSPEMTPSQAS